MADIGDILGKKKHNSKEERIDIDGICEECYWPLDYGFYDAKNHKLRIVCVNSHERTIDWNMDG